MSKPLYKFENAAEPGPLRRLSAKETAEQSALSWPLVLDSKDESAPALLEFRLQARILLHNQEVKIRALESENEQLKAEKEELEAKLAQGEPSKAVE
jgi:hypothetical protein